MAQHSRATQNITSPAIYRPPVTCVLVLFLLHHHSLTHMSGLIDIWTLERERMLRAAGAARAFRSLGGGGRRDTARPEESAGRSSDDGAGAARVDAADERAAVSAAAAAASTSTPGFVREDAFLSILVDCFGQ